MPAATPFLTHSRVLGAADRHTQAITGVTDIAADAFTNFFQASFFNLFRQKGVCNRRSCGADKIHNPAPDL